MLSPFLPYNMPGVLYSQKMLLPISDNIGLLVFSPNLKILAFLSILLIKMIFIMLQLLLFDYSIIGTKLYLRSFK